MYLIEYDTILYVAEKEQRTTTNYSVDNNNVTCYYIKVASSDMVFEN